MSNDTITAEQAAEFLHVSQNELYRLVAEPGIEPRYTALQAAAFS